VSNYQPLSVRRGIAQPRGPYEGVPEHLTAPLIYWLEGVLGYRTPGGGVDQGRIMILAMAANVPLQSASWDDSGQLEELRMACRRNDDTFLDVIDAVLAYVPRAPTDELRTILQIGGSAWTVAEDGGSLQRRVDPATSEDFARATSADDRASLELRTAFGHVYGREPNASDAWDHAIKAVEEALIPIVVPNKAKANLGDVAGQLKAQPERWALRLDSSSPHLSSVETLEALLRLVWPNPDRHGGNGPTREPSLTEAAGVVQLAVMVVQWARSGVLSPAR